MPKNPLLRGMLNLVRRDDPIRGGAPGNVGVPPLVADRIISQDLGQPGEISIGIDGNPAKGALT